MKRDPDRERRHDEKWQAEVIDGMNRMLAVLHDVSDAVRDLGEVVKRLEAPASGGPPADKAESELLSVAQLAELLGITPASVYGMRSTRRGPVAMKVGRRLLFRRADVEAWLSERRDPDAEPAPPWRRAMVSKGVGAGLPRSTEPPAKQPWCPGSHTEPLRASKYQGMVVCRDCRGPVSANRDGKVRKHRPNGFPET